MYSIPHVLCQEGHPPRRGGGGVGVMGGSRGDRRSSCEILFNVLMSAHEKF